MPRDLHSTLSFQHWDAGKGMEAGMGLDGEFGGIVPELEDWEGLYRSWRVGRDCILAGGLGWIVPELESWEGLY